MERHSEANRLTGPYILSGLVLVLMAVVSAAGAFAPEWLYRDNELIRVTFQAQDFVTLVIVVPAMAAALWSEMRGSARGRIVWLASLVYAFYGYLFYAFGAAFNVFFLLYVAVFGLAFYALAFAAWHIDHEPLSRFLGTSRTRWMTVAYAALVAVGLGVLWTALSASFWFTGEVPGPIVASGHPTGVVFAIDLVFIVPPMVLVARWLSRGRPLGWVLGAVMSVTGTLYTLSLAAASVWTAEQGVTTGAELPVWVALTALGAASVSVLLGPRRASTGRLAEG